MHPADAATGRAGTRVRVALLALVCVITLAASLGGLWFAAIGWLRPPPDPATSATAASTDGYSVWERNEDGAPVRWDACSPVELVFAPRSAPDGARADLEQAVATLREVSGLDLVVVATTDEQPSGDRLPFQPEHYGQRWAPVLVGWASPGARELPLRDTDRGVAIPVAVGPPGARTYVSGQVVLNAERHDLRTGTQDRSDSWGATILHELAHVLGLGHVDDPAELMHVYPGEGPVELGEGDRAGLRAVGAEAGCLEVPTPRPVEVAGAPPG